VGWRYLRSPRLTHWRAFLSHWRLALRWRRVDPHLLDESNGAFEDRLRRVLPAPVAHPQIHPGEVNPCNLLLQLAGVRGVEA